MPKSASKAVRYKPSRRRNPFKDADYHTGISDEKIHKMVGGILTLWPHIEEQMIPLFAELIGTTDNDSARLMFRSIINNNTRIAIMRTMLQRAPQHQKVPTSVDALIDEFHSLSRVRNGYAHGLWRTRKKDGKVFLEGSEESITYEPSFENRRITEAELQGIGERVKQLLDDLLKHHWQLNVRTEARQGILETSRHAPNR